MRFLSDSPADDPPRQIPSTLECFLVLGAAMAAVMFASSAIVALAAPGWHDAPAGTRLPAGTGIIIGGTLANELAVGAVVGGYLWLRRQHRAVLVPLGLPSLRGLAGTLLVVLGAVPWADLVGVLMERWMGQRSGAVELVVSSVRGAGFYGMLGLVLALAVVPAVVEETLFRGVITAGFGRSWTEALLVPSVLFGAFHLEPQQAAATAVLGIAFGIGRLCTGSVLASMCAHAAYNTCVLLLIRLVGPSAESRIAWPLVALGTASLAFGIWLLLPRSESNSE
jgi:membrane protease YdiL (CAAX protease family)